MERVLVGIILLILAILVVNEVITYGQIIIIALIGTPIIIILSVIYISIEDKLDEIKWERKFEEDREKAKIRREKKKLEAKKNYKETLKKLQKYKENFEQEGNPLNEKFFKEAVKLSSEVRLIKKADVDDGKSIFAILKFARLNVFSSFEDEEKAQNYADKLRSSLKKLSSFEE